MRAAVIDQYGGMPRIDDVVQPLPSSDKTLVAVKATALIPLDLQFAAGHHHVRPTQFPYIPGFEVTGEMIESSVFAVGQRVRFECRPTFAKGGSFAEYTVVADAWAFPLLVGGTSPGRATASAVDVSGRPGEPAAGDQPPGRIPSNHRSRSRALRSNALGIASQFPSTPSSSTSGLSHFTTARQSRSWMAPNATGWPLPRSTAIRVGHSWPHSLG